MPSCGLTQVYGASAGAARPRPPFWCTRQTNPIGLNWIEQRPVDHHRRSLAQYGPAFPGAIWRGVDLQRSERGLCTIRPYRNVPWYVAFNSLDSGGLTQNFMSKPL